MKQVLITFGTNEYIQSKNRLFQSAKSYFDKIILYDEGDIDKQFYTANLKIFRERRGWGYWLWKPYLILKTLISLEKNDICFYVDATSIFTSSPNSLIELTSLNKGIVLFKNSHNLNYVWTKADCFNLMGLTGDQYMYGDQVEAGFQIYKKNSFTLSFLKELLSFSINYNIISDSPNITGNNHPQFKDHRHDQSILSLLAIKHKIILSKSPRQRYEGSFPIIDLKRDVKKLPYVK
jgi:hypothetical protein